MNRDNVLLCHPNEGAHGNQYEDILALANAISALHPAQTALLDEFLAEFGGDDDFDDDDDDLEDDDLEELDDEDVEGLGFMEDVDEKEFDEPFYEEDFDEDELEADDDDFDDDL